jgi:hypothetical protein
MKGLRIDGFWYKLTVLAPGAVSFSRPESNARAH